MQVYELKGYEKQFPNKTGIVKDTETIACAGTTLEMDCPKGTQVSVQTAFYGRESSAAVCGVSKAVCQEKDENTKAILGR